MHNELITTLNFVRVHGPVSVKQISEKTGLHKLTVHRHLNGGRGKKGHKLFIREKITGKLNPDRKGKIRGKFYFIYSINECDVNEDIQPIPAKKSTTRDPITSALFGFL